MCVTCFSTPESATSVLHVVPSLNPTLFRETSNTLKALHSMATVFNHEPAVSQHADVLPNKLIISLNFLGLELLLDAHLQRANYQAEGTRGVFSPSPCLNCPSPFLQESDLGR